MVWSFCGHKVKYTAQNTKTSYLLLVLYLTKVIYIHLLGSSRKDPAENQCYNRPLNSYGWKQGWWLPCFDTNLIALFCKSSLCQLEFFKDNFHNKAKEVCFKTRSPSASHWLEFQGTKSTTVKWSIKHKFIQPSQFHHPTITSLIASSV